MGESENIAILLLKIYVWQNINESYVLRYTVKTCLNYIVLINFEKGKENVVKIILEISGIYKWIQIDQETMRLIDKYH